MTEEKTYLPHGERLRARSNLAPQTCSTFHRVWSYLVTCSPSATWPAVRYAGGGLAPWPWVARGDVAASMVLCHFPPAREPSLAQTLESLPISLPLVPQPTPGGLSHGA